MEICASAILGIPATASCKDIELAFRQHPERMSNNNVHKAYIMLSSPFLRNKQTDTMQNALANFHYMLETKPPI
jgi:hypothetical protein